MWLAVLMTLAVGSEIPIERPHFTDYRNEIAVMADLTYTIGDNDADRALLSAVQYFESRHRGSPKDGDCRPIWKANTWVMHCSAFGPMQLSKGVVSQLPRIDPFWSGVTLEQLREPRRNIAAAYTVLNYWRSTCNGSPGVWLTAYGWGRCPPRGYVDGEGRRRCALATAILRSARRLPDDWKCGHEGKQLKPRTRRLIKAVQVARSEVSR